MQTYQVGLIALGLFSLLALFAIVSWRRRVAVQAAQLEVPRGVETSEVGIPSSSHHFEHALINSEERDV